jgi:hypothetical protein
VLLTCATFKYLDMLCLLLASHRATNPDVPLHVHAIDWPENALAAARSLYPAAFFHAHPALAEETPMEMKGPVPRSSGILRLKVQLLHQSYMATTGPVTWVDADTLLLSPLKPLERHVAKDGDFGVTCRNHKRRHARFAVAVVSFARTERAGCLLDRYAEITRQTSGTTKRKPGNEVAWFHDQLALWQAWRELSRSRIGLPRRNAPRLVPLSTHEHSIDGTTEAIFVSRRDRQFDTDAMIALLAERDITVSWIEGAGKGAGRSSEA